MNAPRWYIGVPAKIGEGYRAFRARIRPSQAKHGRKFSYVIGPFRTMRGARWAEQFGFGNPAFVSVDAAERIAKYQASL